MSFNVPPGFKHFYSTRMGTHWFMRPSDIPFGEPDYLVVQDTEASLERNVAMANHNDGWSVEGSKSDKLLRRMAHVPFVVMEKWKQELGVDYRIDASASIDGTFETAISEVVKNMEHADVPPKAIFYRGNQVLRVVPRGVE